MKQGNIGLKLRTLHNLIRRYFENSPSKKQIDSVTGTNGWIICFLSENESHNKDIYQKDLEKHFTITRSTTSKVLNLMEQKELIERHSAEHDARLKKIVLTDRAREISGLMKQEQIRLNDTLTKGFSNEELEKLDFYLETMIHNVKEVSYQNTKKF